MRVLILGGTRFIGLASVSRLAGQGHEIAVFHRGNSVAELPEGVTEMIGDRHEIEDHRAGLLSFRPEVVLDMLAMTEAEMRGVLDVFRGHVPRMVVISSCDVYRAYGALLGHEADDYIQPTPLTEQAELRPRLYPFREAEPRAAEDPRNWLDDYDKILVERAALNDPDFSSAVLRLPMVYGPRDGQHRLFNYLKRMDDGRPAILLSDTDAQRRFSRGFVDNVGQAIALAVSDGNASGIYNVADAPTLTEQEWVAAIAKAAGCDGRIAVLPDDTFPAELRSGGASAQDLHVSSARIREELGFSEIYSLEDALIHALEWQRANPPEYDPAQFDYATEDELLAAT